MRKPTGELRLEYRPELSPEAMVDIICGSTYLLIDLLDVCRLNKVYGKQAMRIASNFFENLLSYFLNDYQDAIIKLWEAEIFPRIVAASELGSGDVETIMPEILELLESYEPSKVAA